MSRWIEWNGGECPIDDDTLAECQLRSGMKTIGLVSNFGWSHHDCHSDIVSYRILEDTPVNCSVLDTQVGGDHYKEMGEYQPWKVLKAWLTPEEFRGYMKGTAIAYLAREKRKGGDQDIQKAAHTLAALVEMMK